MSTALSTARGATRLVGLTLLVLLVLAGPASAKPKGRFMHEAHQSNGGSAVVGATFNEDCTSVTTTSTKDLSNVVLVLTDSSHHKFDGLSGYEATFDSPDGQPITGVYIKSGANFSGAGPGYGEYVPAACGAEPCTELEILLGICRGGGIS